VLLVAAATVVSLREGARGRECGHRCCFGDDFGGTVRKQQVVLDVDLNVSGGLLPSTFSEGFEGTGVGTFTTMTLDTNMDLLEPLREPKRRAVARR
jgi:hypothetical protein